MTRHDGRRMFFVDENLGESTAAALRILFRGSLFRTAKNLQTRGLSDVNLLGRLSDEQFDGIITRDRKQLVHDDERVALRRAGLHWVGVDSFGSGRNAVSRMSPIRVRSATMATLTLGLPLVLETWADRPTAYHLASRSVGRVDELSVHAI
ncbi:hypothetical protein ACMA46_07865 [Clavibacter sp. Sh2141]|uniref:PIN-like domain-containing protein n=1 Tax=Clavibacter sp. Sh2141 TaxID=3395374 RepID=UPI0039BC9C59